MIQAWLRRSGTRFRELGVHQRQLWPPVSVQSHDHFKQPIKTLPGLPGLCVLAWWFCVLAWWVQCANVAFLCANMVFCASMVGSWLGLLGSGQRNHQTLPETETSL